MRAVAYLPWAIVGLGTAAAICWWVSSWVALMPRRRVIGLGGNGTAAQQLGNAVRLQSVWHGAACAIAGTAALLQALAVALRMVGME